MFQKARPFSKCGKKNLRVIRFCCFRFNNFDNFGFVLFRNNLNGNREVFASIFGHETGIEIRGSENGRTSLGLLGFVTLKQCVTVKPK